nr:unnamed protein product [Callosobruchus analis]
MQECRGKRILELGRSVQRNSNEKIVVHSDILLASKESPLLKDSVGVFVSEEPRDKEIVHQIGGNNIRGYDYDPNEGDKRSHGDGEEDPTREECEADPFDGADDGDKDYDPDEEGSTKKSENLGKRSRWNKADKTKWRRNIEKKCRNLGQAYTSGKRTIAPKAPQIVNCSLEEQRKQLCSSYWELEDFTRKKENAKVHSNAKVFYLLKENVPTRVCQNFFLKTMSNGPLNKAFENRSKSTGLYSGSDKRGKHVPSNKISQEDKQVITNHIESFPLTESHYCRKSSQRKYQDARLSIAKMYTLYKEICEKDGHIPRSMTTYKRIFCQEYNYSFFKPRKDQCAVCMKYQLAQGELSRESKPIVSTSNVKLRPIFLSKKTRREQLAILILLLRHLTSKIPSSDVSPMYYSRKLCGYNLTIYKGAPPNNAYCYTWSEVNGARGSIEIATCIFQYIRSLPRQITEVSFFSDTCGGQNRNQNVLALLYYFVHYEDTPITVIEQKFLESGHSMMECDSMHSAIEHQKKYLAVYTLNDWINIFKMARSKRGKKQNDAYFVKELKYTNFIDFKTISQALLRNKTINTQGEKVRWLQVKCF